jgi:hypothetical protein
MNVEFSIGKKTYFVSESRDPSISYQRINLTPTDSSLIKSIFLPAPCEIRWSEFIELFNEYASKNKWRLITDKNKEVRKRFDAAKKTFPKLDDWKIIIEAMEKDPFYSGKSGIYTNPCALTLFRDSRYCTFYEAGTINKGTGPETIDSILDDFRNILKGIA